MTLLLSPTFVFRKSLSEVTACLRERLHRWQQIEKLCGFPVVSNSGLPSLTASLYSDHSWVVMPRVSVPPYPIAGGVDDLDEDTPPIIPQFTSEFGKHCRTRTVRTPDQPGTRLLFYWIASRDLNT